MVAKHSTIRYITYGFLFVCYSSNFVRKINFEKCPDLEIGVKGHSGSSELTRSDPPPMTSY